MSGLNSHKYSILDLAGYGQLSKGRKHDRLQPQEFSMMDIGSVRHSSRRCLLQFARKPWDRIGTCYVQMLSRLTWPGMADAPKSRACL